MFVGGHLDGHWLTLPPQYKEFISYAPQPVRPFEYGRMELPKMETVKYNRRRYTNSKGESFIVMVLESMQGWQVLKRLGERRYEDNPLPGRKRKEMADLYYNFYDQEYEVEFDDNF